ncbi:MAG: lipopolysaccharide heptosyltransferase II [bacterium]
MNKNTYLTIRRTLLLPFLFIRKIKFPKDFEIKKILVLRHDRIGDMILSTGIFHALKKKYPDAYIIVLASKTNSDIIQNNPDVDEILIYKGIKQFIKEIRKKKVDLAVDLFFTYELKQAFLAYLSGARYRLGFENAGREIFFNIKGPGMDNSCSMNDHLAGLISCLDMDFKGYQFRLNLSDEEKKWAENYMTSHGIKKDSFKIAVHPGGFYPSQRWPEENFVNISEKIMENYSFQIILFGDKNEEKLLKNIKHKIESGNVSIFCSLTLRQAVSLLNECDFFIGNNSGLLHIAYALKIPAVSMMGPTDPVLWRPEGENNIVLRKDLECSPCGRAKCEDHKCMNLISADEVFEAVKNLVEEVYGAKKYKKDSCN